MSTLSNLENRRSIHLSYGGNRTAEFNVVLNGHDLESGFDYLLVPRLRFPLLSQFPWEWGRFECPRTVVHYALDSDPPGLDHEIQC